MLPWGRLTLTSKHSTLSLGVGRVHTLGFGSSRSYSVLQSYTLKETSPYILPARQSPSLLESAKEFPPLSLSLPMYSES